MSGRECNKKVFVVKIGIKIYILLNVFTIEILFSDIPSNYSPPPTQVALQVEWGGEYKITINDLVYEKL